MRRVPLLPTALVALAVAAMIALGLWQLLDRLPQKEAFLRQVATNPARPPVAWPRQPDDALLFRRTSAMCLQTIAQRLAGAGGQGFRIIVTCRTGAEGPGLDVQLGTTRNPRARVAWRGGPVSGFIAHRPDNRSVLASLSGAQAPGFMIIADRPAAGLGPNAPPDLDAVPNNHLAYGVQWFAFAAIATVIYALALRRRIWPQEPGRPPAR